MNLDYQQLKCASCGLPLEEIDAISKDEYQLCQLCTFNGTSEPNFETIVTSVALGYFMNVRKIADPQEALYRAHEFISQLAFWQDKAHINLPVDELKNASILINLVSNMENLESSETTFVSPDFFISHSWEGPDKDLTDPLVASLKAEGYYVWYDKDTFGTESGKIEDWMKKGITQSRFFLIVLSQSYFSSKACLYELNEIISNMDPKFIFPVWWTDVTKDYLDQHETGKKILDVVGIGWNKWQGNINKLVDVIIQLANNSEGLKEYNGTSLIANEARVLERLETILQDPIPLLENDIQSFDKDQGLESIPKFGFQTENNHITGLFLEDKGLKDVPNSLAQCIALKHLNLAYNQCSTLPENFKNLSQLITLKLIGNPLVSIPESFIPQIKKFISLSYSQVNEREAVVLFLLECQIGKPIPHIEKIKKYPTVGYTRDGEHVIHLELPRLGLKFLPESFGNLSHLRVLNLKSNGLKSLPKSFEQLKHLEKLWLHSNQLQILPETFDSLKNLVDLRLRHNQLRMLPESFGQLVNLETLILASNHLESLPESFGQLEKLKRLNLGKNKLNSLPESFPQLKNLQNLSLGDNQFTSLPETFGKLSKLEVLYLSDNQFQSLPESLGKITSLTELRLYRNQLMALPKSLGQLNNLHTLDVQINKLTSVPSELGELENLQKLDLSYNPLESLPGSIKKLQARGCRVFGVSHLGI